MSGEFHCHVTAGKPKHAASHAMYILRLGKYSGCDKFEDLVHGESGNMPKWAVHDPIIFWECADEFERKNGTPYSEIEFSLPNELSDEQCIELLRDYVQREFGTKHAYTFAFHSKISELAGARHKHAHVVYSERVIDEVERGPEQYFGRAAKQGTDPAKGGCRKLRASMSRTEKADSVEQQRARCCAVLNEYLERFGQDHTYDHRSFKRQGRTDRIAQDRVKVGDLKRMSKAEREKLLRDRQAAVELELASIELSQVEAELEALGIDIEASLADANSHAHAQDQAAAAAEAGPVVPVHTQGRAPAPGRRRAAPGAPAVPQAPAVPGRPVPVRVSGPGPVRLAAAAAPALVPGALRMAADEPLARELAVIERYGLSELTDESLDYVRDLMIARLKAIQADRQAVVLQGGTGAMAVFMAHQRDNQAEFEDLKGRLQDVREVIAQRLRGDVDD
jgi:hypothetical protein